MNKLKERWGITSNWQLTVIFIVFAINGSLSAKISGYLMKFLGLTKENLHWSIYYVLFFVLVLPLYPFMLMVFGWLFGQSKFFFPFSKKLLKSIGLGFIFSK
ncbi:DUF6787 family protein [Flavobacterium sp.]|uniref:DUF6787 family protein n=1 Tax=Flavobacterium sp. TaxID=239 RepID=UPI003D096B9E